MIERLIDRIMAARKARERAESASSPADSIALSAKGHITAELYDASSGETVERIDQDNLIVNDATSIILKCLSGVAGNKVWKIPVATGFMAPTKIKRDCQIQSYYDSSVRATRYRWAATAYPAPTQYDERISTGPGVLYCVTFHDPREGAWSAPVLDGYTSATQAQAYEAQAEKKFVWSQWQEYRYDIPPETKLPVGYTGPESLGLDNSSNLYTYWSSREVKEVARVNIGDPDAVIYEYSPSFIALGEGSRYDVNDDDPSISYTGSWTRKVATTDTDQYWGCLFHSTRWTTTPNDSLTFKFKGTQLVIYYTQVEDGAKMGVTIDDVSYADIDCWYSGVGAKCQVAATVVTGLADAEHTVVLRHTGTKNAGCASATPRITFEGYATDGLHVGLKRLYKELSSVAQTISLPELYNTTNEPPYEFTLLRLPVPGTEKVTVGGVTLTRAGVGTGGELLAPGPGQYQIDYSTGKVQLYEGASRVAVTYQAASAFATGYARALIEKPVTGPDAPIYNFAERKIVFRANFPAGVPNYPVKITEMALMDGTEDDASAKMFSIVRLAQPLEKYTDLGLRVSWELTIQAKEQ